MSDTQTKPPPDLVIDNDPLERQYDEQFVPLYKAAREVRKRFDYVQKLCTLGKVTHRVTGPKHMRRIRVHLPELRRFIREMEIRRPGTGPAGAAAADDPDAPKVDLRRREFRHLAAGGRNANLHPAVLKMIDPKRRRAART